MNVNPLRTWSRLSPSYTTDADAGRTSGQAPSPLSLSGTKSQVELSSWVLISHGQWERVSLVGWHGTLTDDWSPWWSCPVCYYAHKTFLLLVSCPTVLTSKLHSPFRVNHEHLMLKLLRIKYQGFLSRHIREYRYFRLWGCLLFGQYTVHLCDGHN